MEQPQVPSWLRERRPQGPGRGRRELDWGGRGEGF